MAEIYETILQISCRTCNSTIIETYVDIIRISHGFEYCQSLRFIAELNRPTSDLLGDLGNTHMLWKDPKAKIGE